jgi:hypothetical protein
MIPTERLQFWKSFRIDISKLDLDAAIQKTNHLWSYSPFLKYYLSTDNVANWPDPWELIYENEYCDLARALGIVYTLYLTDHREYFENNIEIRIYRNMASGEVFNTVFIGSGKYVLNMIHDEVVNNEHIDASLRLVRTISFDELNLKNIH